ncbi:inactive protein RESTRICTED TEV MOVEMENT 2-like [Magnolia sinica]|uniref:inactive protein RESTRICTED TEV MOVEMENT 2-like n=1 Tax=Magnolia sinica TaxID=86752 RepID=UPI00265ABE79|nr:inactive protein RESTRICTED TEV MOVEMENT 2-like [Magnolia sinica]
MARSYKEFEPSFDEKQEDGCVTVVISLPEFKKDQLRIQLDNYGNMKISGERQIDSNKWNRFRKYIRVPKDCILSKISAKFENGALYVTMPKTTTQARWSTLGRRGFLFGLNMPKKMVVGVVIGTVVVVALGIYVAYNVRSQERNVD